MLLRGDISQPLPTAALAGNQFPAPLEPSLPSGAGRKRVHARLSRVHGRMQLNGALVRLADEGIPIRALARGLQIPSEDVREILGEAVRAGNLLVVPKDDWPPGSARAERLPAVTEQFDDDVLILHTGYCFGVTRMQSAILLQFLRRREVTRDFLHATLEAQRAGREPAPRWRGGDPNVNVVLWALRRKLKPYFDGHRVIVTVTGQGYFMVPEYRRRANEMLAEHLGMPWRQPN